MLTLGIETSGKTASAALVSEGEVIGQTSVMTGKTHSQVILPMVKRLLEDCGKDIEEVDRIAVGVGPGSYTGIRIGIAAVKAMAFALGKKCLGVSTLEGLVYNLSGEGIVCAVMKARQELVYSGVFEFKNSQVKRIMEDRIIECESLDEFLLGLDAKATLVGDFAKEFYEKYKRESYLLSPAHLRNQNAAGICAAAEHYEFYEPDRLCASYLQLVKAEKDLINKNNVDFKRNL